MKTAVICGKENIMSNDKNKTEETTNMNNKTTKDKRRPLPKGNIIGKRPEIFNLTYKNMYKKDNSSN